MHRNLSVLISIRGIEFLAVNSYILGVNRKTDEKANRPYSRLRVRRAAKGLVERHDVFVGLPTGGRLLVCATARFQLPIQKYTRK